MFALTRNPNYLGEILMYAAFNLLAPHWLPWVASGVIWMQLFLVNTLRKDRSLSRYPGHTEWVRQTALLLPSLRGLMKRLDWMLRLPPE